MSKTAVHEANTKAAASAAERTRRQLEELDALLQQMLALPVADSDSTAEPKPEPVPAKAAAPRAAAFVERPSQRPDPLADTYENAHGRADNGHDPHGEKLRLFGKQAVTAAVNSSTQSSRTLRQAPDADGETAALPIRPILTVHRRESEMIPSEAEAPPADAEAIIAFPTRVESKPAAPPPTPPPSPPQLQDEPLPFQIHRVDPAHETDLEKEPEWQPSEQWIFNKSADASASVATLPDMAMPGKMALSLNRINLEGTPAAVDPAPRPSAVRSLLGWTGVLLLLAAAALALGPPWVGAR